MEKQLSWNDHLKRLHSTLMLNLGLIEAEMNEPLLWAKEGREMSYTAFKELREFIKNEGFPSIEDEIHFFRVIKPSFQSYLIYYTDVFEILLKKPIHSLSEIENYYKIELAKLNHFFENNLEFVKYYRLGDGSLDTIFFTRAQSKLLLFNQYGDADPEFTSMYDFGVARGRANELLAEFIGKEINESTNQLPVQKTALNWTAPRTDLVELSYLLKVSGAINNGSASVKEILDFLQNGFNTEITNSPRYFQQILFRQEGPDKFTSNALKNYRNYIDSLNDKNRKI